MDVLYFVLLVVAVVLFVLGAFQVRNPRVHLLALGLAFWVAVPLIQTFRHMVK